MALNTNDIAKKKDLNPDQVAEVKQWMETVLGKTYDDFWEDIRDGVELCELVNKIKPGTCKKFKKSNIVFVKRANIQIFIQGCGKLGVPSTECIETRDLFDQQNLNDVVLNLYALGSKSRDIDTFAGPYIGKKYAKKNKRVFTKATLDKGKTFVPAWNKGSNENKFSGMDGAGIVKTDKDMQTHSGVQSKWEMGAKPVQFNSMDGAGIVKTDKSMQHPSAVQGVWDKGAKPVNKTGIDAYGIVKTDKSMQNPSQVQGVWDIGSKPVQNSSIDAYGIVKTDKDMQNPSQVQGVWDKGSVPVDNTNQDAYGIIKTVDNADPNAAAVDPNAADDNQ